MKNREDSIRRFVTYLNNSAQDGGYWLPNIQRRFVWKEEQIERLYDSILREYPIGTLLIWRTNSEIKRRKFIDIYKDSITSLAPYFTTADNNPKMLVLDGQQRLQSLMIGLLGSYNDKELFIDILSGQPKAPDDIKYDFKFKLPNEASFPWVKFKELVFSQERPRDIKNALIKKHGLKLSNDDDDTIQENIETIRDVFVTKENIIFQVVDSIDRPALFQDDDIVEIFIRANSGGTPLGKSDLLFSLLTTSWSDADDKIDSLLEDLNRTGYKFTRDFILKTCLVLLDKGSAYNVTKFRTAGTKEKIEEDWDNIAKAITDVKDYIYSKTFIKTDDTLSSYLVLMPLIYYRYKYYAQWKSVAGIEEYLIRSMLSGAFSGSPDILIDHCVTRINEKKIFDLKEMFSAIREKGRSLEISSDTLLKASYGSSTIHLLLNLWYDFNYQALFDGNRPQVDHIFPQSALKKIKSPNPETGKMNIIKYKEDFRNQLANCMLLTKSENGPGGKWDILPKDWFKGKDDNYFDLHLIPKDPKLWELDNFEAFIEARKKMILTKFDFLLIK